MAKKEKKEVGQKKSRFGRAADWLAMAPPAIISALTPWYDLVFSFPIVSDYWQPGLRSTASGIAAIAFIVAYVRWRGGRRDQIDKGMLMAGIVSVMAFVVCLGFWFATSYWNPGVPYIYAVWFVWLPTYIVAFVGIAVLLAGAALRMVRR